ncbi:hypothetical protein [Alicyclobacillus sp. ALC3]|uniref:hypothetical protein n=1 Tax=Alicyclobacillus sp. ALC3 TaxID=2796143 RepID=UPI0023795795|nr:hypothetical protein [Alicyclobacillus sp. ALC3]WDL99693.1 hypothetical protein JC200_23935 [Alicyclobacillus sp. ALC3]
MSTVMRMDHEGQGPATYTYTIMHMDHEEEVQTAATPDELIEVLAKFAQTMGFQWNELPIAIYAREEGAAWQAVYGADDKVSVLFPLPLVTPEGQMTETDFLKLGKKVMKSYVWLRASVNHLTHIQSEKPIQKLLREQQQQMAEIEQIVKNTEWERIFELKYILRLKHHLCAKEANYASRTLDRKVKEMTIHIGRVLHATLTARRLKELIELSSD